MRVAIDVSYSGRGRTGTGGYVEELVRALRARDDVEVVCVRQRRRLRAGGRNRLRSAAKLALDRAWTRFGLPRAARLTEAAAALPRRRRRFVAEYEEAVARTVGAA